MCLIEYKVRERRTKGERQMGVKGKEIEEEDVRYKIVRKEK